MGELTPTRGGYRHGGQKTTSIGKRRAYLLPALPAIGADLNVLRENGTQLVVTAMFVGFAVGQLFFGPISDSAGRKTPIYVGLGLFMLGSILAMSAWNFPVLLVGRILQGFGAAGPRTRCRRCRGVRECR